jgi:hypothetical protein
MNVSRRPYPGTDLMPHRLLDHGVRNRRDFLRQVLNVARNPCAVIGWPLTGSSHFFSLALPSAHAMLFPHYVRTDPAIA